MQKSRLVRVKLGERRPPFSLFFPRSAFKSTTFMCETRIPGECSPNPLPQAPPRP